MASLDAMRATLVIAALLAAGPALAQERDPAARQTLVNLAYVIGESHALRQVCQGAEDQYWRERMYRLIETESPDQAFDRRLKESFNSGFIAGQAQFTACSPQSRAAEAKVAGQGRALAERLAKTTLPPPPSEVAQ